MLSLCQTSPACVLWTCSYLNNEDRLQLGLCSNDFIELLNPLFRSIARLRFCQNKLKAHEEEWNAFHKKICCILQMDASATLLHQALAENGIKCEAELRIAKYWNEFNEQKLTHYYPLFISNYDEAKKLADEQTKLNDLLKKFGVETPEAAMRSAAQELRSISDENFKLLLNHANIDKPDEKGNTALHLALQAGNENFAHLLLAKNANSNTVNVNDETPLHRAVLLKTDNLAGKLIARGADIFAKNKKGFAPLDIAFIHKQTACLALLRNKTIKQKNVLLEKFEVSTPEAAMRQAAAKLNSITSNEFQLLVCHVNNIDQSSRNGNTALHWALKSGNANFANLLMDYNANCKATNKIKETPLHFAVMLDSPSLIKKLIDKGANLNAKDKNGRTPLDWALKENKIFSVSSLRGR